MKTHAQKLRASIWDKVVALASAEISPYPILIDKEGDCYHYRRLRVCKSACLLYTSPSPRDRTRSRMPSSA